MASGLEQLNNLRQQGTGRRNIPPSRHPARPTPVETAGTNDAPAAAATPAQEQAPTPQPAAVPASAPAPAPKQASKPRPAPAPAPAPVDDPLISATVYLSASNDDFLEDVKRAGRRSQPKIDANRSAVVRLALTRLAEQMAPEQVAQELSARAGRLPGTTGRTRL
ncbi:hypothetical protein [Rhodococcus sp. SGAir0479]|uniref:hypothetical protein n=1 Tax=Rhodococcus sp. SGAir0479 TaxID=2567884 RepID=UPI0010CCEE75|nr:hypothetical protein [Rhodococcus sp. SGAir0479]QCQ94165.1 hypothetical protein E7742_22935 [Rhodococcus sp. SGAir0479]